MVSRVWDISSGTVPFLPLAGRFCRWYANGRDHSVIKMALTLCEAPAAKDTGTKILKFTNFHQTIAAEISAYCSNNSYLF
jgi:hypothetical protein